MHERVRQILAIVRGVDLFAEAVVARELARAHAGQGPLEQGRSGRDLLPRSANERQVVPRPALSQPRGRVRVESAQQGP
jgi:hypothetical protein